MRESVQFLIQLRPETLRRMRHKVIHPLNRFDTRNVAPTGQPAGAVPRARKQTAREPQSSVRRGPRFVNDGASRLQLRLKVDGLARRDVHLLIERALSAFADLDVVAAGPQVHSLVFLRGPRIRTINEHLGVLHFGIQLHFTCIWKPVI
jgi:hypothetical protein